MLSTPPTLAAFLLAASTASAAITIPTVMVGDTKNPTNPFDRQFGSVSYEYLIGKFEVTNSQYTAFLNAVAKTDTHSLYNSNMAISQSGEEGIYSYSISATNRDKPVTYVCFWDAARFANWLTNGQPKGLQGPSTTETGMYDLGGVTNPDNSSVTRQIDFSAGQNGVAVTSENEWYKAAYYIGYGDYYDYPTQTDERPKPIKPEDASGSNNANYNNAVGSVTKVGAYPNSGSHYGTFDQGGNVFEWNDEITGNDRVLRGGSFLSFAGYLRTETTLMVGGRPSRNPTSEVNDIGFRVTSLAPISESSQ